MLTHKRIPTIITLPFCLKIILKPFLWFLKFFTIQYRNTSVSQTPKFLSCPILCTSGVGQRQEPRWTDRRQPKLALGTRSVTSLVGKGDELVREILSVTGRNGLPDQNPSGDQLLNFCVKLLHLVYVRYLRVLSTIGGRSKKKINRRISAVSAVMWTLLFCHGEEETELEGKALNFPVNLYTHPQ